MVNGLAGDAAVNGGEVNGNVTVVEKARRLLLGIVQLMVNKPSEASVSVLPGKSAVIFEIAVADDDVCRVIGRNGKTADSLRCVLSGCEWSDKRRWQVQILEPRHR